MTVIMSHPPSRPEAKESVPSKRLVSPLDREQGPMGHLVMRKTDIASRSGRGIVASR